MTPYFSVVINIYYMSPINVCMIYIYILQTIASRKWMNVTQSSTYRLLEGNHSGFGIVEKRPRCPVAARPKLGPCQQRTLTRRFPRVLREGQRTKRTPVHQDQRRLRSEVRYHQSQRTKRTPVWTNHWFNIQFQRVLIKGQITNIRTHVWLKPYNFFSFC